MLKIPVTAEDHIQGKENAPLTLVEYGDYECSYCGLAYSIVKQIQAQFGNRLRFVFRNFPLINNHPHAGIAAATAEFAARQNKFWECTIFYMKIKAIWICLIYLIMRNHSVCQRWISSCNREQRIRR